jgi:hypothetical protein
MPALPVKVVPPAMVRHIRRPQFNKPVNKRGYLLFVIKEVKFLKPNQRRDKKGKTLGVLFPWNQEKGTQVNWQPFHGLRKNKPARIILKKRHGIKDPAVECIIRIMPCPIVFSAVI